MKQKRSTEWKGRGFNDRRGKTYRIEEDRRHRWKRKGALEGRGKRPRCKRGKKWPLWKRKGAMEERSGILNERGEASPIEKERSQD